MISSNKSLPGLELIVSTGALDERGAALDAIRGRRLYRSTGLDFERYCRDRFGFGRNYAGKLIRAARRRSDLRREGLPEGLLPKNESAARGDTGLALWAASAAKRRRVEWVYFIRCSVTGLIKIGKSIEPRKRLLALQTGAPGALELLSATDRVRERDVHKLFADERLLNEWFRPSPRLLQYIADARKGAQ